MAKLCSQGHEQPPVVVKTAGGQDALPNTIVWINLHHMKPKGLDHDTYSP